MLRSVVKKSVITYMAIYGLMGTCFRTVDHLKSRKKGNCNAVCSCGVSGRGKASCYSVCSSAEQNWIKL
jgi:hypothetical protein